MSIAALLEEQGHKNDTLDDATGPVPALDELSDLGDPYLRGRSTMGSCRTR